MGIETISAVSSVDGNTTAAATDGELGCPAPGSERSLKKTFHHRPQPFDRQTRYAHSKSGKVLHNANYLQRLRVVEGAGRTPSVEPFDKIILSFDFYQDIRDEKCRTKECSSLAASPGASVSSDGNATNSSAASHTPDSGVDHESGADKTSQSQALNSGQDALPATVDNVQQPDTHTGENSSNRCPAGVLEEDASATDCSANARPDPRGAVEPDDVEDSEDEDSDDEFSVSRLRTVPTYFNSTEDYVDTFFPLFIQEAKQSIHRAKKLEMSKAERFIQVNGEPQGDFIYLTLERAQLLTPHSSHYCHNDLVLLYLPEDQNRQADLPSVPTPAGATALGSSGRGVHEESKGDAFAPDVFGSADTSVMKPEDIELQLEQGGEGDASHDLTTVHKVHVLGIVQQSVRSTLVVKILMPVLSQLEETGGASYDSQEEGPEQADGTGNKLLEHEKKSKKSWNGDGIDGDVDEIHRRKKLEALRRSRKQKRRKARRERILALTEALNDWQTPWRVCRVMGLTTLHREFQGLMSVPDLLIKKQILCPSRGALGSSATPLKNPMLEDLTPQDSSESRTGGATSGEEGTGSSPSTMASTEDKAEQTPDEALTLATCQQLFISSKLRESLHQLYNASQLDALNDCLKIQGVTLIQGPPGTGKTTTIMAVISVVLNAQMESTDGSTVRVNVVGDASGTDEGPPSAAVANPGDGRLVTAAVDETEQEKAKRRETAEVEIKKKLAGAQPWLSFGEYVPWMDEVVCMTEDLEGSDAHWSASATANGVSDPQRVFLDKGRNALLPNRVLVCAPSNAAIDEILKRLVAEPSKGGGIFDSQGKRYTPSVVRVGPNVHPDLVHYSLEYKANQLMKAKGATHFSALAAIKAEILQESRIVCATLSVSGCRDIAAATEAFDTVVIDEASQGVEMSTLIPLRLGCRRLILVGDPRQLPATIFSRVAIQHRYDQSLFQRLEAAGHKVNMLSVQYRMHPCISKFASSTFYQNQLQDAENIVGLVRPPIPWYSIPIFKPLVFFAINTSHTEENTSLINVDEANFVCQLVDLLKRIFVALGRTDWEGKLAIISPYAQQVSLLRQRIKAQLRITDNKACPIDVNTVDGFQGQEKDLIIFSAVRAQYTNPTTAQTKLNTSIGFLADERRINVALTRGRTNLWIVGNGRFLMSNHHWRCLWKYTKELGTLISIEEKFMKTELLLAKWLLKFTNKHPPEKSMLDEQVPSFLPALEKDVKECAAARKARKVSTEDVAIVSPGKE
ncbi:RNA-directed RNA polymerase [Toxoplasma gondii ME49]|uniref:RNA-directed RNA polymerase n=4 Tax=Toxoplasma gondii TaxID=5811 RepID=S7VT39_TOXGG|nr:RNA-directed RNA polymerase [Toxoplasma gondii ME49]EPR58194.1 RNA-directed RNA polymerase [Toxoplasma gondii GT1]EPT31474.1 RNA-directed RNA polymerase [Toxoplasma gondii ME49]KAF4644976.1 RNA-directed RNA polymerase [Toxoplasma gondii]KYF39155.1 RNA-directed RNA polymerase [Toxoplasma gondii ARI]|eukprot:XP_018638008.1 RNA-directed RNA polymerase [Toxoplasma gondii ME49]